MISDPERIKALGLAILWERIKLAGSRKGAQRGRVAVNRFRKMCRA